MENLFNTIRYKVITYFLNEENNYYHKEPQLTPFEKLPQELKVEETQKDFLNKQGANQIIRGRVRNGKYLFFTGLIKLVDRERVFFGNNYESIQGKKITSLIVFEFSVDYKVMTVYYFNHFYKDNRTERIEFVSGFIKSLKG